MLSTTQHLHVTQAQDNRFVSDAVAVFLGSVIIALCSQVSLTIPFTVVPFSLQAHAVLFLSAVLGPKRGLLCVLLYLAEGVAGFPVFSHGRSTLFHLLSPGGGYLLSYIPVSYFVGYLVHSPLNLNPLLRFSHIMTGNLMILSLGTLWLATFTGFYQALILGFLPFLVTDVIKSIAVSRMLVKN